jgi:hypothetical protein
MHLGSPEKPAESQCRLNVALELYGYGFLGSGASDSGLPSSMSSTGMPSTIG